METDNVIGCLPIQFENSHRIELENLISELPCLIGSSSAIERNLTRFEKMVQLYGDEAHLLDSALPQFVASLLKFIDWPSDHAEYCPLNPLSLEALIRIQVLTRVRGYKMMIRLLPHEVTHLNDLLRCLEYYANETRPNIMQSNARLIFMLTVWLLIICKNPFNLKKFDNAKSIHGKTSVEKPVAERIIDVMSLLKDTYIMQGEMTIVSTLLAQILTRNDDNLSLLLPRITASIAVIKKFDSETDGGRKLISCLRLLISLFKWGRRKEMKVCAHQILENVVDKLVNVDCVNIEVRNLAVKLLQHIALVLLRPRLADWRYKCGYRSLEESLKGRNETNVAESTESQKASDLNEVDEDDESDEIPYEIIEKLIDELLNKINDRDNLLRWTAAKSIARICARLNREMAAEVVAALLKNSFESMAQSGGTWHGSCLALAELCRRGCLLPDQVPQVISSVLSKAFVFEQSMSGFVVGISVRDAACYICWAFARAYEAQILNRFLSPMGGAIVCLALFDREVNIRRAASAAFQENVGRNNCFSHGIEILTIIDYADVALIRNSYLNLSILVAKFEEYRRPMLDHLNDLKTQHWDESIRELASEALQLLVCFDCDYSKNVLLPKLCARLNSKDHAIKHGTMFAISSILTGLFKTGHFVLADLSQLSYLKQFVHENLSLVENHRVKGYTQLAKGLCRLIEAMCIVGVPLTDEQLLEYHNVLDLLIADKNKIHVYAASTFNSLINYYNKDRFHLLLHRIFHKYFSKIEKNFTDELLCFSSIAPLAHISVDFLSVKVADPMLVDSLKTKDGNSKDLLTLAEEILIRLFYVILNKSTPKWVFARVAAIEAATNILSKFVPENYDFSAILDNFIYSSDDYTSTVNGDIGRVARKTAVLSLVRILPIAFASGRLTTKLLSDNCERITIVVSKIIQRCCESIDDLRTTSCLALTKLLQNMSELPMADRDLLKNIFLFEDNLIIKQNIEPINQHLKKSKFVKEQSFKEVDWIHAKGFIRLAPLLGSSAYRLAALEGFVLSAGSIAEWTSQNAYAAVALHIKSIKKDFRKLESFLQDLSHVYNRICLRKCSVSPVLLFFRMLLNDRVFAIFEHDPDSSQIFSDFCMKVTKIALGRGTPKIKCLAISVMGCLLQFNAKSKIYRNCLTQLLSFLESPYTSLREVAVEQLFEAFHLINDDDIVDNENDGNDENKSDFFQIYNLLTQTPWSESQNMNQIVDAKQQLSKLVLPNLTT